MAVASSGLRGLATHRAATWTSPIRSSATVPSTWSSCRGRSSRSTRSTPSPRCTASIGGCRRSAGVIRFDHRGMGMSSRIGADKITPACWAEDVGRGDGRGRLRTARRSSASGFTAMSALFLAGDRPERVANLVIVNGAGEGAVGAGLRRRTRRPAWPVRSRRSRSNPTPWSRASTSLELVAPSVVRRSCIPRRGGTRREIARRRRAWPAGRARRWRTPTCATNSPHITAPTLVLHRKDSAFVPVGHGRYLAEHIAGARYVELPGADALYWVGDSTPIARRDRRVHHRRPRRCGRRTRAHHNCVHRHRRLDATRRRPRRRPVARPARQPRHHRPPRTRTVPRYRSQHRRRRLRRDLHQPQCRASTVRDRDRRRGPPARHRGPRRHPRGRGRGARRRHRRHGGAHRCAGVGALAGPSEVLVSSTVREIVTGFTPHIRRARRARTQGCAGPLAGVFARARK